MCDGFSFVGGLLRIRFVSLPITRGGLIVLLPLKFNSYFRWLVELTEWSELVSQ